MRTDDTRARSLVTPAVQCRGVDSSTAIAAAHYVSGAVRLVDNF